MMETKIIDLPYLKQITQDVLKLAKLAGASSAETETSYGTGQNVSVRLGETETIEYNRDKGVSVTVYFGQQKGHASTSDLSATALKDAVEAACNIAKYTANDEFCGLADANLMATELLDLDLYHPWNINVDEAVEIAKQCEAAAMDVDKIRITNSEGASVSNSESIFTYANTHGFMGGNASSRHSISCSVIAEHNNAMQRDYWYSSALRYSDLESATSIGKHAAERTIRRLNPRSVDTGNYPVLFSSETARSLIGHFLGAVSGASLYRRASFLLDSIDTQIFPEWFSLLEQPHIPRGLRSANFDAEGVATREQYLIENGVLQHYLLGSYSARKLGLQSSGNAGGVHNLDASANAGDLNAMLSGMGRGLLVTELMGQGVNGITGDYSRGAAGFWVEGGEIQYPVDEITIAGNLKTMFQAIEAVGSDVDARSHIRTGSILIGNMTVAGEA